MREVTKKEFFATVGQLNVHPRPERDRTFWEIVGTRKLVGESTPGYLNPQEPSRYYVAD